MGFYNRNNGYIGFVNNSPIANTKASVVSSTSVNTTSLLLNTTANNGQQNNTFLDSSTNNFTITRNGTPTQGSVTPYWPDGQWSNYFSGSGQYITAPAGTAFNLGSGNFTAECWVYLTSFASSIRVFGQTDSSGTSGSTSILMDVTSGVVTAYLGYSSTPNSFISCTNSATITTNAWYHLAMVRNGSEFRVYVNGAQGASSNVSGLTVSSSAEPFTIGRNGSFNGLYVPGYVSNLRIVKGTALYTSNFTPSTTPLTAVSGTSLLTCQSNRFRDNSSNNFAITVTGAPSVQRFSPFDPAAEYSTSVIGGSGFFSGSGQYLSNTTATVTDFGAGNFTVEYWVYPTTTNSTYQQHVGSATTSTGFGCGMLNTAGTIYATTISTGYDTGVAFARNVWTHIAWVRNGTTLTAYRNGVSIGSFTVSTNFNETGVGIGAQPNGAFITTACYLSNIRIVKGTAVYTAAFTPPTSPVTAITGTSLLLNCTNAGIYDAATLNDLVTVGDAQASTTQSKYSGSSIYFDGTNDYIYCTDANQFDFGTGDFTVEAWIRPSSVATSINNIAGGLGPTNGDWMFALDSSTQLRWGRNHVAWDLTTSGVTFSANTWYHVAVTRSGTTLRIFVDGITRASATNSTAYNIANSFLAIGARQANSGSFGPGNFFNGYIEDFRVIKGYAAYTADFTPPAASLTTSAIIPVYSYSDYYGTGVLTNIENQTQFVLNSVPGLAGKFFNGTNWRSILASGNIGTLLLTSTNDSSNVTGTTGLPSADHRYGVNRYDYITYSSVGDNYGFIALGYFKPPATGSYTFYTSSDDYSGVWLGGIALATSGRTSANALVNNGMGGTLGQGNTKVGGTITLYAGIWYPIRVVHEEGGGGDNLTLSWSGPGITETTDLSQHFRTPSNGNILTGHYI
jgi:hypothetical protein